MISLPQRIAILLAIVVYYVILVLLLRKKSLTLRYTLLWMFSGLVMLIFTLFPGLLEWLRDLLGFSLSSNALFAILFFFGLIILVSQTAINSRQGEAIKRLTQEVARLEKRVRELEEEQSSGGGGQSGGCGDQRRRSGLQCGSVSVRDAGEPCGADLP